jgi:hypothetical protein
MLTEWQVDTLNPAQKSQDALVAGNDAERAGYDEWFNGQTQGMGNMSQQMFQGPSMSGDVWGSYGQMSGGGGWGNGFNPMMSEFPAGRIRTTRIR